MSDDIASAQFAGYFRRWQEIEDAKQKLSDESKDLFADMKAAGYDSKATRAVFRDKRKELNADPAEVQEKEAIYGLYMDALNRGLSKAPARPAPAHVENIEKSGAESVAHDADGVVIEQGSESEGVVREAPAEASAGKASPSASAPAESSSDKISAPTHSPDYSSRQVNTAGVDAPPSAPAPISDAEVPAFLRKPAFVLRPHCLRPELCGSGNSDHCYSCRKAMAGAGVAA